MWSLPLLTTCRGLEDDDIQDLAYQAVLRLELATGRGDAEFLVSRRDWLVSEDPDLQGLRAQPRFKSFEAAYFPSPARIPQRPREVHRWEVSRYTLDLLLATAQRWTDEWERRARDLDPVTDTRVLLRWCEDDLAARRLIRDVAVHHRDWRTRYELVSAMRGWGVEYGFEPVEVAFPSFRAESGLGLDQSDVEEATQAAIHDKDLRLREVVHQLDGTGRQRGPDDSLVHATGLPHQDVARLCTVHASLWRSLGELVTPDAEREEAAWELAQALRESTEIPVLGNGALSGSALEQLS